MEIKDINEKLCLVEENSQQIQSIVDNIVHSYSNSLDELMRSIYSDIIDVDDPPTIAIEKAFIKLSNILYFVAPNVEQLGIRDGISKITVKEAYNDSFISNKVDPSSGKNRTAAELTAISESDSKYDAVINDTYNRAYKILKAKVDSAQTMCSTLSKILSIRSMNEAKEDQIEKNRLLNEVFE